MAKKNRARTDMITDCACVIHGSVYDWQYVEKLYAMLNRHLPDGIRFHVYTEPDRAVPGHMIKHELTEWRGIVGPRKSWWYKMQLFNAEHWQGNLLYLDLDVVVHRDMSWAPDASTDYFWTIRDFRYLQNPRINVINSSLMWWNVPKFDWVYQKFVSEDPLAVSRKFQGDQDYIHATVGINERRYFDDWRVQSWRWQAHDGGYDFKMRRAKTPNTGTKITDDSSVLIFHGKPKPHEISDPLVVQLWA